VSPAKRVLGLSLPLKFLGLGRVHRHLYLMLQLLFLYGPILKLSSVKRVVVTHSPATEWSSRHLGNIAGCLFRSRSDTHVFATMWPLASVPLITYFCCCWAKCQVYYTGVSRTILFNIQVIVHPNY
jgi:hypothetical protein